MPERRQALLELGEPIVGHAGLRRLGGAARRSSADPVGSPPRAGPCPASEASARLGVRPRRCRRLGASSMPASAPSSRASPRCHLARLPLGGILARDAAPSPAPRRSPPGASQAACGAFGRRDAGDTGAAGCAPRAAGLSGLPPAALRHRSMARSPRTPQAVVLDRLPVGEGTVSEQGKIALAELDQPIVGGARSRPASGHLPGFSCGGGRSNTDRRTEPRPVGLEPFEPADEIDRQGASREERGELGADVRLEPRRIFLSDRGADLLRRSIPHSIPQAFKRASMWRSRRRTLPR